MWHNLFCGFVLSLLLKAEDIHGKSKPSLSPPEDRYVSHAATCKLQPPASAPGAKKSAEHRLAGLDCKYDMVTESAKFKTAVNNLIQAKKKSMTAADYNDKNIKACTFSHAELSAFDQFVNLDKIEDKTVKKATSQYCLWSGIKDDGQKWMDSVHTIPPDTKERDCIRLETTVLGLLLVDYYGKKDDKFKEFDRKPCGNDKTKECTDWLSCHLPKNVDSPTTGKYDDNQLIQDQPLQKALWAFGSHTYGKKVATLKSAGDHLILYAGRGGASDCHLFGENFRESELPQLKGHMKTATVYIINQNEAEVAEATRCYEPEDVKKFPLKDNAKNKEKWRLLDTNYPERAKDNFWSCANWAKEKTFLAKGLGLDEAKVECKDYHCPATVCKPIAAKTPKP